MNMNSLDEVLKELKLTKHSMDLQNQAMAEVINTSNSALLQVEGNLKSHSPIQHGTKLMRCRKETIQAFAEILERLKGIEATPQSPTALDFLERRNQRLEFLCMSVRKLLAMFNSTENLIDTLTTTQENESQCDEEEREQIMGSPFN